jgi:hypothetical protein
MSNVCLNHHEKPICACGMNTICSFCKQGQGHIPCKCSSQTLELINDDLDWGENDDLDWGENDDLDWGE